MTIVWLGSNAYSLVEVVLKSKSGGGVEVKEWRWC